MRAEIIALGDELTSGQRLDTNSQWLSHSLATRESGLFITPRSAMTGRPAPGLPAGGAAGGRYSEHGRFGPHGRRPHARLPRQACGVELVRDEAVLEQIRALFARRGREMPERNVVQAMFPRGSRVIANPHGTAPGIDIDVPRTGRTPAPSLLCRAFRPKCAICGRRPSGRPWPR